MASEDLLSTLTQWFEFAKSDLPKLQPFQFALEESLSLPYVLNIRLVAADPSIDESQFVGEACTLTLMRGGPGGLLRHISGLVAQASFTAVPVDLLTPDGNLPTGVVDLMVVPAVWALSQRRNNRIFQNKKVTEILKEVLEEGLKDYGRKVTLKTTDSKYQTLEYCTQYDETDLEFVERMMATEGVMSYFKQGETDEELVLFDDASNYLELVTLDHGKVSFEADPKGSATAETVSAFEIATKMTPTSAAVRFFNWSSGSAPDETKESSQDAQSRDRELYYGEAPVTVAELDSEGKLYKKTSAAFQAKLIQQAELAQKCLAKGDGIVSGMTPGMTFEMDNALRTELNQKYLIIGVSHHGRRPGDQAKGSFAGDVTEVRYSNSFYCVPADVLLRLGRPPRRAVQMLQTAIVVGDEDITTDTHGRIKVQFHWDRKGQNDIKSSCWIRVAQFSAGMGYGAVFIPRKGQEVVVAFLEGDPNKPLVVGSVYNGGHQTPYDLTGQQSRSVGKNRNSKTRSVIRTRSTPDSDGYNEISFEDAKDSEELYVQAQKDMCELVKNNHDVHVKKDETVKVDGNQTETIGGDQLHTVTGSRTHTVKKDETITIEGNQSITIKGGGQSAVHSVVDVTGKHTLDASDTIHIQAPTSITLECGDSKILIEPKKITFTAGDGSQVVLDANVLAESNEKSKVLLDANVLAESSGKSKVVLDGNVLAQSSGKSSLTLDTDAALDGKMNASVTGKLKATLNATPGSVKASPQGVETSGPKIDMSGMAMVSVSAPMVKVG